jgi:hypothetical protein
MTILDNGRPDRRPRLDLQRQQDDPASFTLSDAEKAEICKKAKLTVANELKDRAEKVLLEAYIREERELAIPEERLLPIFLDLAPVGGPKMSANYIMLDGVQYFHNQLHYVTDSVFRVLLEQMNRGWAHEEETEVRDEKNRRRHRAPSYLGFSNFQDHRQPRNLVTSSGVLAGATPESLLGLRA